MKLSAFIYYYFHSLLRFNINRKQHHGSELINWGINPMELKWQCGAAKRNQQLAIGNLSMQAQRKLFIQVNSKKLLVLMGHLCKLIVLNFSSFNKPGRLLFASRGYKIS